MSASIADVRTWTLARLEVVRDSTRILLRDPLRLLPESDGSIHRFAIENGYVVIEASTNLVFRDLYERAIADPDTKKVMVIDRAPPRRPAPQASSQSPAPFYPDLLAQTPEHARIQLDLRQFLIQRTGDPDWPREVNEPRYARLIVRHLDGVLRAHRNLRTADERRFNDRDLKTIVAFAALGIADSAFKRLAVEDYWKIGLFGLPALDELETLAPEVTAPIKDDLKRAPEPFCWFIERDPETVVRAFYLSVILAQHSESWSLLLANINPSLRLMSSLKSNELADAAVRLIRLDPEQARRDLEMVEQSLDRDTLQFLLIDQLRLDEPAGFATALERERYSTLTRSAALLLALDNLLSGSPARAEQTRIVAALFPEDQAHAVSFADQRSSSGWAQLKEAYRLANDLLALLDEATAAIKTLRVKNTGQLSFDFFRDFWNKKRLNRLEYELSALERLIDSNGFLPRPRTDFPATFSGAMKRISDRVRKLADDVYRQLDEINRRFQEYVVAHYPTWISSDGEVILTSQFLHRCLKPHWDPQREKAVVFIFDGMRYDIWDELLRPLLLERMELVADLPGSSLLPSETHITRKAISAGTTPDQFDSHAGEDQLLKGGLAREFGYNGAIEVLPPEGSGTGETVRYRAGNLDVFIFELCDKELHNIRVKTLSDGRVVPSRPLAFIYQQLLKNIIDTEVMAIVRNLAPRTKVFVTADHGFGRVARDRIGIEDGWLNEPEDCMYLNARLQRSLSDVSAHPIVRNNVWELPVGTLHMPATETEVDRRTRTPRRKTYATIIFPKTGHALGRPGTLFRPDAYTHGGISIQELMIPMIVLRVKPRDEGLLTLGTIVGPQEVVEGEEIEVRLPLNRAARSGADDLRIDVDAELRGAGTAGDQGEDEADAATILLPHQVLFVPLRGAEAVYRFRLDTERATADERRSGIMELTLTITVSYRESHRTVRKSQTQQIAVNLKPDQVIRRIGTGLGNILGLTPKSMRG